MGSAKITKLALFSEDGMEWCEESVGDDRKNAAEVADYVQFGRSREADVNYPASGVGLLEANSVPKIKWWTDASELERSSAQPSMGLPDANLQCNRV